MLISGSRVWKLDISYFLGLDQFRLRARLIALLPLIPLSYSFSSWSVGIRNSLWFLWRLSFNAWTRTFKCYKTTRHLLFSVAQRYIHVVPEFSASSLVTSLITAVRMVTLLSYHFRKGSVIFVSLISRVSRRSRSSCCKV